MLMIWRSWLRRAGTGLKELAFWPKAILLGSFLLAILTWSAGSLRSQTGQVEFQHVGSEQGLSQATVRCIFQDRQGFLWFGTQDGLNKYDGYTLTVYRHDQ